MIPDSCVSLLCCYFLLLSYIIMLNMIPYDSGEVLIYYTSSRRGFPGHKHGNWFTIFIIIQRHSLINGCLDIRTYLTLCKQPSVWSGKSVLKGKYFMILTTSPFFLCFLLWQSLCSLVLVVNVQLFESIQVLRLLSVSLCCVDPMI